VVPSKSESAVEKPCLPDSLVEKETETIQTSDVITNQNREINSNECMHFNVPCDAVMYAPGVIDGEKRQSTSSNLSAKSSHTSMLSADAFQASKSRMESCVFDSTVNQKKMENKLSSDRFKLRMPINMTSRIMPSDASCNNVIPCYGLSSHSLSVAGNETDIATVADAANDDHSLEIDGNFGPCVDVETETQLIHYTLPDASSNDGQHSNIDIDCQAETNVVMLEHNYVMLPGSSSVDEHISCESNFDRSWEQDDSSVNSTATTQSVDPNFVLNNDLSSGKEKLVGFMRVKRKDLKNLLNPGLQNTLDGSGNFVGVTYGDSGMLDELSLTSLLNNQQENVKKTSVKKTRKKSAATAHGFSKAEMPLAVSENQSNLSEIDLNSNFVRTQYCINQQQAGLPLAACQGWPVPPLAFGGLVQGTNAPLAI